MRNQIEAAQRLGVRALRIDSSNTSEWQRAEAQLRADQVDALLISPERLANQKFVESILRPVASAIGLVVVDEAHCISDWGHDFRPDYRRLVSVLRYIPRTVPILGTTATANDRVIADVRSQLGDIIIQRGPLMRESLALQAMRLPDQAARLSWLAEYLPTLPGTGIVYVLTQRDADQVARWLNEQGIRAEAYHSGVSGEGEESTHEQRERLEQMLLDNQFKALVATTALGMGYDKPDLGFVVHYQAPGSIIAYYQQVGRAGRAIARAVGVLMAGQEDTDIQGYFRARAFPAEQDVQAILQVLERSSGLSARALERTLNLRFSQIEAALKFLAVNNPAPVLKEATKWVRTPVPFRLDQDHIRRLTQQREREWEELQAYVDSPGCRMHFLAQALDDEHARRCGRCDRCLGRPIVPHEVPHARTVAAQRFLRHAELRLTCKKQVAPDAFPVYGFRGNLPDTLRAEEGRILARWGDAGWGRMVAEDKERGHFRDELVEAVVEMVRQRWRPGPAPLWVTCVPSQRHRSLVPDFARRVAQRLGLPFKEAVVKIRDNEPQKQQQNRFHQCHNLDGAFEVRRPLPRGPVLLVDDVVDSAWTFTVVGALLRQAGSGPVWPLALAQTSPRE